MGSRTTTKGAGRPGRWRDVLIGAGAVVLLLAAGVLAWQDDDLREAVLGPVERPQWQSRPFTLRAMSIERRDAARAAGDLLATAEAHAALAAEALRRTRATHDAWMTLRDPQTLLFPERIGEPEWNYRNPAADFFGFQLQAAMMLDLESLPALRDTMRAEAALAPPGALCQPVNSDTGEPISEDHDELLFASSEYVKDGLISVVEHNGDEQSWQRMLDVLDAVVAHSRHPSRFGPIPSTRSEPNGNVLQMCSRLSFSTEGAGYAEMAARIADAVVQQMLPANHGLPAHEFDFEHNQVIKAKTQLRDHGNELIVGLTEAYAMAVARAEQGAEEGGQGGGEGGSEGGWRERADRWAQPILHMLEIILEHGINERGMLGTILNPATLELTDAKPTDNWGYIAGAVLLFNQAARRQGTIDPARLNALLKQVDAMAMAVAGTDGVAWEDFRMDGYADSIESALYVAAHRPAVADELKHWADDQLAIMFGFQEPDGFVDRTYLDGNFMRTAMLYARMRTGGFRLEPWDAGTRLGYARDQSGQAVVVIHTADGYHGKLLPDRARHRTLMNLPWDWPRLNSWPQWLTAEQIEAVTASKGFDDPVTAEMLRAGLRLDLAPNEQVVLHLRVND